MLDATEGAAIFPLPLRATRGSRITPCGVGIHGKTDTRAIQKHARSGRRWIPRITSPEGRYIPGQNALCRRWGGAERILEDKNLGQEEFCEFKDGSLLALRDL